MIDLHGEWRSTIPHTNLAEEGDARHSINIFCFWIDHFMDNWSPACRLLQLIHGLLDAVVSLDQPITKIQFFNESKLIFQGGRTLIILISVPRDFLLGDRRNYVVESHWLRQVHFINRRVRSQCVVRLCRDFQALAHMGKLYLTARLNMYIWVEKSRGFFT